MRLERIIGSLPPQKEKKNERKLTTLVSFSLHRLERNFRACEIKIILGGKYQLKLPAQAAGALLGSDCYARQLYFAALNYRASLKSECDVDSFHFVVLYSFLCVSCREHADADAQRKSRCLISDLCSYVSCGEMHAHQEVNRKK